MSQPATTVPAPGDGGLTSASSSPGADRPVSGTEDTRARIIDATLATLREAGVVGTSARAIARAGGFNQALIFYHFGSVHEALLAAVDHISTQRMALYRQRLTPVTSMAELLAVGARCHAEDAETGNLRVLAQLLAGASGSPELTDRLRTFFDPWVELVEEAVARAVADSPLEAALPTHDLAMGVVAMFMGIELMGQLYDTGPSAGRLFTTAERAATALASLGLGRPGSSG